MSQYDFSHKRGSDSFDIPHRREADKLIESLLAKLIETHSILGELSGKVDSGLSNLNTKFEEHTVDEMHSISQLQSDFLSFKCEVSDKLKDIDKVMKDLNPIIEDSKNKALIWIWATEKVPKVITNLYRLVLFAAAVVGTSWAFIEFIVHNKLGK